MTESKTTYQLLRERDERLKKINEAIAEIEERTLLRAQGRWSETHNNFLTIRGDDATKALADSATADGGFAQQDYYMLKTLLLLRSSIVRGGTFRGSDDPKPAMPAGDDPRGGNV